MLCFCIFLNADGNIFRSTLTCTPDTLLPGITCVVLPIRPCRISSQFHQEPPRSSAEAQGGRKHWLANRSGMHPHLERSCSYPTGQRGNPQLKKHRNKCTSVHVQMSLNMRDNKNHSELLIAITTHAGKNEKLF